MWYCEGWSVLGVEEGNETGADIAQKFVEFFLGVESVSLAEDSVVVPEVLPDFVVEVATEGGDQHDGASYNSQTL